jgi:hypothetical protein
MLLCGLLTTFHQLTLTGWDSCNSDYQAMIHRVCACVYVQALGDHGFPVPTAIDNNRHAVLMELVDAQPLVQVGAGNVVVLHSVLLRLV